MLLTDSNGNPVLYKSGENKGKRRYICSKAQKTLNHHFLKQILASLFVFFVILQPDGETG